MRAKLLTIGLLCVLPVLAGARIIDRIAAIVNDDVITESEVMARAYPFLAQIDAEVSDPAKNAAQKKALIKETLQGMVDEKLLSAAATELGITVTTEEVDRAIDQILNRNGLTIQDLEQALKQQGQSLKRYREDVRDQLIRYKVIGAKVQAKVNVTDEEANKACEDDLKNKSNQGGIEVELQQMVFVLSANATEAQIAEKRKKAEDAIARVQKGEDFAKVAKEVSEDTTIDLGSFDVEGLDPVLGDPLKKAKAGDIVGPVKEPTLFRVLKLVNKKATAGPSCKDRLEDYRAALQEIETQKILTSYLNELRKKAYIDVKLN